MDSRYAAGRVVDVNLDVGHLRAPFMGRLYDAGFLAVAGLVFEGHFKAGDGMGVVVVKGPHIGNQVYITTGSDMAVDVDVGDSKAISALHPAFHNRDKFASLFTVIATPGDYIETVENRR